MLGNPLGLVSSSLTSLTPTIVWQGPAAWGSEPAPCPPTPPLELWGPKVAHEKGKFGREDVSAFQFVHLKNRQGSNPTSRGNVSSKKRRDVQVSVRRQAMCSVTRTLIVMVRTVQATCRRFPGPGVAVGPDYPSSPVVRQCLDSKFWNTLLWEPPHWPLVLNLQEPPALSFFLVRGP